MSISVRAGLASRVPQETGVVSIRMVVDGLHLRFPTAFRDLVSLLEPIKLTFQLNSGTCSGACEITMTNDGLVHYTGRVHDSGALAAAYVAITSLPVLLPPQFRSVIIAHKGHVGGTLSFDSRDSTWDEKANDARIADNWAVVKAAATSARTDFGTSTGALELIDGVVAGASGIFIFSI